MISLDQARAAGLSRHAVARRVASREWHAVGVRVYQAADHVETACSRTFAAMLSVGDHATLVGRSAAWWWRLWESPPARVEIAVAPSYRPRERIGVDVIRRAVDPADRADVRGLVVTARAPTVLDAAARLGLADGARLMDQALLRGRVTLPALREVNTRDLGRHGAVLTGALLALAGGGARSEAERVAHARLHRAGIRGWTPNEEILLPGYGRAIGDIVFDERKVVAEVDGWAYHRDLRAFLRDGPRQSALAAAGWTVLRTHWYELREDPDAFLTTVRRTLAGRC